MYLDQYTDENDVSVRVVYGIRVYDESNSVYALRIVFSELANTTRCEANVWRMTHGGWPFVDARGKSTIMAVLRNQPDSNLGSIADDIFKFCEKPHGQGAGIMDILRNLFSSGSEKRKHKS